MQVRLFNVRNRKASQRNTIVIPQPATPRPDVWDLVASLDPEFDSFGHYDSAVDYVAVAPGLIAHDGSDGPVVHRKAA